MYDVCPLISHASLTTTLPQIVVKGKKRKDEVGKKSQGKKET